MTKDNEVVNSVVQILHYRRRIAFANFMVQPQDDDVSIDCFVSHSCLFFLISLVHFGKASIHLAHLAMRTSLSYQRLSKLGFSGP